MAAATVKLETYEQRKRFALSVLKDWIERGTPGMLGRTVKHIHTATRLQGNRWSVVVKDWEYIFEDNQWLGGQQQNKIRFSFCAEIPAEHNETVFSKPTPKLDHLMGKANPNSADEKYCRERWEREFSYAMMCG